MIKHPIRPTASAVGCSPAVVSNLFNHNQWPKDQSLAQRLEAYCRENNLPYRRQEENEEVVMLTEKAKQHFMLAKSPFVDDVQAYEDVYLGTNQRYVRQAMWLAAKQSGFIAVVGESGAGKSVLRRELIDRIRREQANITVIQPQIIDKARLTAGAICDAIIEDISQERPMRTLEAKSRQIQRLLTGSARAGNSHVLLIEEAHDLNTHTLKYLKRFWELEDGFKRLLAIVLIGQPELKLRLSIQHNWDAREVIRRCEQIELQAMDVADINEYLQHKCTRIGTDLDSLLDGDVAASIKVSSPIAVAKSRSQ